MSSFQLIFAWREVLALLLAAFVAGFGWSLGHAVRAWLAAQLPRRAAK